MGLKPLFVEVCAGRASLTKAAAQAGFQIVSIDHQVAQPLSPIVSLDLTSTGGQSILWDILGSTNLFAVHIGLPCGTSSRARERPISAELRAQGVPQPPPLRSAEFPLGLPGLAEHHQARVSSANILYWLALEIIELCCKRRVIISIENPANSWLWTCLVHMARESSLSCARSLNYLEMVTFHACCHGSTRRKNTGWLGTPGIFHDLAAVCQNDHPHDPWGVRWENGAWLFDTSSEAAYPTLLAQRIAACLAKAAAERQWSLAPAPRLHDLSTAATGRQSKRHAPLIPEYHHFKRLPLASTLPSGAKILSPHLGGEVLEEETDEADCVDESLAKHHKVGFLHTPKQFLSMALSVQHPMDSTEHLEPVTQQALDFILKYPPHLVEVERKKNLLQARLFAAKLQSEESELHSKMPTSVAKVLRPKRLLLWKCLLEHYGYDDVGVVDLMFNGVPLVGKHDDPPCFQPLLKPATLTEQDLRDSALWRRKAIVGRTRSVDDPAHVSRLEQTAMEELQAGFVEGPFASEDEVSQVFGHDRWSVIRRFVLVQGAEQKLRPIDDCLEAQLNFGYTSTFYLKLQDIDYIAGLALKIAKATSSGKQNFGSGKWKGKCLDLSKAYKQMAVRPDHRDLTVLFFHDASGNPKYFIANSLIFGSTAAVYAFNRVSRSLWFLFNKMLLVPCRVFYDDFPLFSPEELATNADESVSELLDLLGCAHARTGPKGKPFDFSFQVLGCTLDLAGIPEGHFALENKPGRIDRICEQLQQVGVSGFLSLHQAQVLHGLLRYACGFFAGRYLHPVCMEVMRRGANPRAAGLKEFCQYAISVLSKCRPRVVSSVCDTRAVLIFTDGSWDNSKGGLGAVIIDTVSQHRWVFSGLLPQGLADKWLAEVGEQIICQIELYAMVAIRWHFKHMLTNRRVIWWVDNEAARFSAIKCVSPRPTMCALVREFYAFEVDHPSFGWIERVPSFSNVADSPSRFAAHEACALLGISNWDQFPVNAELVGRLLH